MPLGETEIVPSAKIASLKRQILRMLSRAEGHRLRVGKIEDFCGYQGLGNAVALLRVEGLVEHLPNRQHYRRAFLELTQEGNRVVDGTSIRLTTPN